MNTDRRLWNFKQVIKQLWLLFPVSRFKKKKSSFRWLILEYILASCISAERSSEKKKQKAYNNRTIKLTGDIIKVFVWLWVVLYLIEWLVKLLEWWYCSSHLFTSPRQLSITPHPRSTSGGINECGADISICRASRERSDNQRAETPAATNTSQTRTLSHLLVFQMCMVSSSTFSCLRACSSRKSKKYLTAGGTVAPEQSTLRKKSSTNCCSVPWKNTQTQKQANYSFF